MNKPSNHRVWEMDRDHFIHPYTNYATFKEEGSQVISRGRGMTLIDHEGREYIDAIAGLWCSNIGHGRSDMAAAIADQVNTMEYCNPFGHSTNEPGAILAARLAELAPADLNHVFYTCGGSTANDTAIRLVHYYNNVRGKPNKKVIISRKDAYHGSTYVSANLTGIHGTKLSFDRIADEWITHVSAANMYRRPVGAETLSEEAYCDYLVNECENRILQLGEDKVAAFIAEPVMGAGGVLVAPRGYHRRMRELCDRYDMLYIADEVVTSFGRLGDWFSSQSVFDCVPDIIVTAKGITSGYQPLGAAILSDRIYEVISQPQCEGGVLSMGFTYTGHPVACAAALKNIEIIERENLLDNVRELSPLFFERARKLLKLPIVGDVRGSHFMMGIECVQNKLTKSLFPIEVDVTHRIFEQAKTLGLIVRPVGNLIVLSPPLVMTRDHIELIFERLESAMLTVIGELQAEDFL